MIETSNVQCMCKVTFPTMLQVDTEVCEQVFSWLSRYKRITQKMNQHTFMFFCCICVIFTTFMRKKTLQGCFYVVHVQFYCLIIYLLHVSICMEVYYSKMLHRNYRIKISTELSGFHGHMPVHPLRM